MPSCTISSTRLMRPLLLFILLFGLLFCGISRAEDIEGVTADDTGVPPAEKPADAIFPSPPKPVDAIAGAVFAYHRGEYEKALAVFLSPEAQQYADIHYYLGNMYALGLAVSKDSEKAHDHYVNAARGYNVFAMHNLGVIYARGTGAEKNYTVAAEWYTAAAGEDYPPAMHNLANLYAGGLGDYEKARYWYERAVAEGDARAMCNLGNLYRYGYGVSRSFSTARKWYARGAAKNDSCCLLNLAWFSFRGWGEPQDLKKAAELDRIAAMQGSPVAAFNLARMLHYGMGMEKDAEKAWHWYNQSAEQKHVPAMEQVALVYEQGLLNQEANAEKAVEWRTRAKEAASEKQHDPFSAASYDLVKITFPRNVSALSSDLTYGDSAKKAAK